MLVEIQHVSFGESLSEVRGHVKLAAYIRLRIGSHFVKGGNHLEFFLKFPCLGSFYFNVTLPWIMVLLVLRFFMAVLGFQGFIYLRNEAENTTI